MTISRLTLAALACAALSACNPYDPGRLKLTPDAPDKAVLLMRINPRASSGVTVSAFDESKESLDASPFGGLVNLEGVIAPYAAETVSPGTYVFQDFHRQDYWHACFHHDSRAFDVRAGEVLFLGEYDPAPTALVIETQAAAKGEMVASQRMQRWYLDDIPPPAIGFPQGKEKELAAAQAFVTQKMPNVTAPVHLAEYRPARFGTGYSLFGDKLCGGYFKGKPK